MVSLSLVETTGLALVEDGTNKHRRPVLSPEGFAEDSDFEERSEDKDVHEDVGNDIALAATGSASKSQMVTQFASFISSGCYMIRLTAMFFAE